MPLFEFECDQCDKTHELLLGRPDAQAECPDCGNEKLTRLLSVPAAPSVAGGERLPISGGGEACDMPRCCGGGCFPE